jgi:hypothetical protein
MNGAPMPRRNDRAHHRPIEVPLDHSGEGASRLYNAAQPPGWRPAVEGAARFPPYDAGRTAPCAPTSLHTTPDTSTFLAKLRCEFPHWGIVHDPFTPRWWALRGAGIALRAATGIELRERLQAATGSVLGDGRRTRNGSSEDAGRKARGREQHHDDLE